jgi:hypothetical protein
MAAGGVDEAGHVAAGALWQQALQTPVPSTAAATCMDPSTASSSCWLLLLLDAGSTHAPTTTSDEPIW